METEDQQITQGTSIRIKLMDVLFLCPDFPTALPGMVYSLRRTGKKQFGMPKNAAGRTMENHALLHANEGL